MEQYLSDNFDKEVAEQLSKEVTSCIMEQIKYKMESIEERANLAAWQIYEEIGLSKHSVDRVAEIIEEKIREQKAIDIDKACEWIKENVECGVHPQSAYGFADRFLRAMGEE